MRTDRILRALVPCACAALLVCGCNEVKEQPEEPYTGMVSMRVTASSGSPDTKVTLTHNDTDFILEPKWETGDKLYLAAETGGLLGYLTLTEGAEEQSAKFEGQIHSWTGSQVIRAYYLGSNPTISGDICTVLAASQVGTLEDDGGVAHKYCFMAGATAAMSAKQSIELSSLTLTNLMSVLYLDFNQTFTESTAINCSGITVSGSLDLKTGTLNAASSTGDVTLSSASSTYYMAILPGSQTLSFTGTSKSSSESVTKTMKPIDFAANKFYTSHGDAIAVAGRDFSTGVGEMFVSGKVLSAPTITNNGNAYAYVRATIVGYWKNTSEEQVAAWESTDGTFVGLTEKTATKSASSVVPRTVGEWVKIGSDGYYYYTVPLQPGASTPDLFTSYTADGTVHVSGSNLCLNVLVQMVDYDSSQTALKDAWGETVADKLSVLTL